MKYLQLVFLTLLLIGCQTYSEEDRSQFEKKIEKFIAEKDLDFNRLESGLYYKIESESVDSEPIKYTDQVTFYYTGEFLNGEVFQQIPENDPLTFKVKELIAGWQEGLMQLKGAGTIKLIIPPHLGYGTEDTEKIPPNSILYYDLTVLRVE